MFQYTDINENVKLRWKWTTVDEIEILSQRKVNLVHKYKKNTSCSDLWYDWNPRCFHYV